jgi:hypothetical protein
VCLDRFGKNELGLTRTDQVDVDFSQQLGIQQRTVLGPVRVVDCIA